MSMGGSLRGSGKSKLIWTVNIYKLPDGWLSCLAHGVSAVEVKV